MSQHDAFGKSGGAGSIDQCGHTISTLFVINWLGFNFFIQRTEADRHPVRNLCDHRTMPFGMLRGVWRDASHIDHTARAAVISNIINLAGRKPRVCEHRPCIHPSQGQKYRNECATVLAHQHDPIAGAHA